MPLTRPKAAQVNFDVTNLSDPLIRLNSGQSGSNDKDTGIVLERGDDTNVAIVWDESSNSFALINTTEDGTTGGDVTISSYANLQADAITYGSLNDGTTSLTSTAAELNLLDGVTGTLVTESATQTLTNKTMTSAVLNAPVFGTGTNSPYFTEVRYNTSNMMKFNQMYTGAATGSYFDPNEYQKVVTITPAGNSENYQVSGRIMAQNAGEIHTVNFTAALRSGDPLPDLSWTIDYTEEYNGSRYIDPQLWTKETTTAGFIFAFKVLSRIYGTVTVDMDIIPRTSSLLSNVAVNSTQNSEQSSVDTGFTARDMTKIKSTRAGRFGIGTEPYTDAHFHIKNDDVGLEFSLDGAISNETRILSHDRTANTRRGMVLDADHLDLRTGGTTRFLINSDGSMTGTGDIIPDADNTRDLGSSGTKFAEVHATTFHGDGSNLTGITSGLFTAITDGGKLTSTETGSGAGPIIELDRNSSSPFNADYLGQIKFKGRNSTDQTVIYGKISAKGSDVTDGAEDGTLEFTVMNNGSQDNIVRINENGLYLNAGADLKFEGTTGNSNETTVTLTDPTADRTITLPDATGTVALTNSFTRFHSATQTVTSSEASTNATTSVNYTFSDLSSAIHYNVYMNRMLLRPAEFSVVGTTLTINIGIIDTDDQLEVTGFKV